MYKRKVLAIDLGASSGRGIIGAFDGKKLTIKENHRFPNDPVMINGSFQWDILRIFHEIKNAIRKCSLSGDRDICSLAVDTWGVDFGLLDKYGMLMENPYHYRDSRTDKIEEEAWKRISREKLYGITGIQSMQFNTIFQLLSLSVQRPSVLENASTLLFTPDLINYFLTGEKHSEYTIASTSALLNARTRAWATELLELMGIPEKLFTREISMPSSLCGELCTHVSEDTGVKLKVVHTGSHDTASAVASVPANNDDFVYISSGTWSLVGVESAEPIINDLSASMDFTNEGGVDGKILVLRNIMGLWLNQETKRQWAREGISITYDEMERLAAGASPCACFINPADPIFLAPGDMPRRIADYCRATGQYVPETNGEIIRCIFDSLALTYRKTLEQINMLKNKTTSCINIVGGGSKEKLLCSLTADACGIPVKSGPSEATAIGNITSQLIASGDISGIGQAREIISNSFNTEEYVPGEKSMWDDAYGEFLKLL